MTVIFALLFVVYAAAKGRGIINGMSKEDTPQSADATTHLLVLAVLGLLLFAALTGNIR